MSVFDLFKKQVKNAEKKPRLVFPEGTDVRILEATTKLKNEKLIDVILLGNESEIKKIAEENNFDLTGIKIMDPETYPDFDKMCDKFVEIRKGKNTLEDAEKMLKTNTYFGTMLVKMDLADGMVSGAAHSTADTVRPALQIVKTAEGMHRVSGVMIMERDDERYIFADCAMNIDPDSDTLAEIGYEAAKIAKMAEMEPKVAFLSFSTKGSAKGDMVTKVTDALAKFKEAHPDIPADGELQFDAAFVPSVGERKAPGSKVAGHANVFVFPELQSGNIGYKIAQRLGKFTAVGPILEGLAAPINDLSRGASAEDVYYMGILTAAQSLVKDE
ncbi:phosphate acetyltransferase [Lactobacillus hamsteri]|uniref:Phosphate acetyltransferase n=1 Tax=Lactobacillus hamsteri DSM 5661 = JCM 6256 TaxID=1423754 RepID=A0A0R1YKK9_9LACO|nr:phosphate acetyltransferase [Lactobacillus hamsteri]KRM40214.1 phosphate acetyltransferase [Lactobacillus hamsteri DSM 5661 = JCM 6256]